MKHEQQQQHQQDQPHCVLSPEDRKALVQYGNSIADCCAAFCACPREVTEIAMNYFDRFMNTKAGRKWLNDVHQQSRGTFVNLIFLTSIYLTLKVHGQAAALPIATIARLSGGAFTAEQVASMETVICTALEWRLHPPTSAAYIRRLLALVPSTLLNETLKNELHDLARLQLEVATADRLLAPISTATITYSSLKISLQSMVLDEQLQSLKMQETNVKQIADIWSSALPILELNKLKLVQDRLCIGVAQFYFPLGVKTNNTNDSNTERASVGCTSKGSVGMADDESSLQYSLSSHGEC